MKDFLHSYQRHAIGILVFTLVLSFTTFAPSPLRAQSNVFMRQGTIVDIRIEGLRLIEKGLIFSAIRSQRTAQLSAGIVVEDIKAILKLGYFKGVSVDIDTVDTDQVVLIFKVVEKPKIALIEITGNKLFDNTTLMEKLKVFQNNMINTSKIKADVDIILEEYRKKGYMQTQVTFEIRKIDESSVSLTYKITESPKVYLSEINITGTKAYYSLDIERLMMSAEVDCFSWANDSGVFHEMKINQDMQIIAQHYVKNGYIKVKIDKPKVVLVHNKDYSKINVGLNITEGDQYFIGKVDIVASDGNEFLFDKEEMIARMVLQEGEIFNPYKQNEDRFKINDSYLEQGYAFARIRVGNKIHEETKTVDITFQVTRGEKAYIGRVEILGNYETKDSVVRRELEIFDNELYNGVKLRESRGNINRLGFFEQGTGVRFQRREGAEENTLDYDILLKETQTGTFNVSLTYSGYSGFALMLSVSKKNVFGTGKTVSVSTEVMNEGDNRLDFSIVNPYWLDTLFTNSMRAFTVFQSETYYATRSLGGNFGLSYPIWKNWAAYTNYSWKKEIYSDIDSEIGEDILGGISSNLYSSLNLGVKYSTVDHPMLPSKGYELSVSMEQYGGVVLGGDIEYRKHTLSSRYFKTLNDDGTLTFGAKFNWSHLLQTNPAEEIPWHKRFTIGGITTVRGFDWYTIRGPSSDSELPEGFDITEKHPYQGDYFDCQSTENPECPGLSTEKDPDRLYYEQHDGGISQRILNLQLLFPLTREGQNIRGLVFFDAGNVWAEDKMYEITGNKKDEWYYRKSVGAGINLITPMGVLRFEYGIKLDKKKNESANKFDFHISGLF
ncbi:MAG: outer membrane protein assembly factor BamA [Proteobacteria bacterium]|nr:outer membrane protein assembly factor BamA [Pseudomonadota bacterium]